jgi:CDP-diacylglycerol--serine O-phosphatidyltransferase
LAAFIYAAAAALRLARFNTQIGIADKRFFQGLASPAAAAVISGAVWIGVDYGQVGIDWRIPAFLLTVTIGILMVSNVRYRSFKDFNLKGRVPFVTLLVVVLVFVFISIDPPQVLFALFFIYAMSGPVVTLITLRRRRAERHHHMAEHHQNHSAEHKVTGNEGSGTKAPDSTEQNSRDE